MIKKVKFYLCIALASLGIGVSAYADTPASGFIYKNYEAAEIVFDTKEATLTRTTDNAHSGAYSLKVTKGEANKDFGYNYSFEKGKTYRIGAFIKSDANASAAVKISADGMADAELALEKNENNNAGWALYQKEFTCDADRDNISFCVQSSEYYIDQVFVVPVDDGVEITTAGNVKVGETVTFNFNGYNGKKYYYNIFVNDGDREVVIDNGFTSNGIAQLTIPTVAEGRNLKIRYSPLTADGAIEKYVLYDAGIVVAGTATAITVNGNNKTDFPTSFIDEHYNYDYSRRYEDWREMYQSEHGNVIDWLDFSWDNATQCDTGALRCDVDSKGSERASMRHMFTPVKGQMYKIKIRLKMAQDILPTVFDFKVSSANEDGTCINEGGKSIRLGLQDLNFKADNWVEAETYFMWSEELETDKIGITFRLGGANAWFKDESGKEIDPEGIASYYIDSFSVMPYMPEVNIRAAGDGYVNGNTRFESSCDTTIPNSYPQRSSFVDATNYEGAIYFYKVDGEVVDVAIGKNSYTMNKPEYKGKNMTCEIYPIFLGNVAEKQEINTGTIKYRNNFVSVDFYDKVLNPGLDYFRGKIEARIYDDTESKFYTAAYKEDGLLDVNSGTEFAVPVEGADTVKTFAWKENNVPMQDAAVIEYEPNSMLIYVDGENGSDSGDGTYENPYKTIEQAKEQVRAIIGNSDDMRWKYSDGVLRIIGLDEMTDYAEDAAPWSQHKNDVRTIIVEDGITSIGSNAFYGFENVKNVILPDGITSIGANAFAGNRKLAAIVIPDSVAVIDEGAFDATTAVCVSTASSFANAEGYKTKVAGVDNDTNLESSGKQSWAVYGNEILVISGSGSSNNSKAPWGAYHESITTILLDYGINQVNVSMFSKGKIPEDIATRESGYPNVTTYIMGDTITAIRPEELTGLDATKLTRWDTSSALTSIGHFITNNNQVCAVKDLFIPKGVRNYSTATGFFKMNNLDSFIIEEGFDGFTGYVGENNTHNGWTSVNDGFINGFKVDELVIPNSVTKITDYTFNNGTIKKLVIKNKDTVINDKAFNACTIISVECEAGSKAAEWAAAKNIPMVAYLAKGTLENGMTWLVEGTEGNYTLTITGTGDMSDLAPAPWAAYAAEITEVKLDEAVTSIGANAFAGFTALEAMQIPEAVEYIADSAFGAMKEGFKLYGASGCVAAYAVGKGFDYEINANLTENEQIQWSMVGTVLTVSGSGEIPDFDTAPWAACGANARTVIIEEGITGIGNNAFNGFAAMKNVVLPNSITAIGDNAFAGCSKLAAIVLGDNVSSVGTAAFDANTSVCVGAGSQLSGMGYNDYTAGDSEFLSAVNGTINLNNINWALYGDVMVISGEGNAVNQITQENVPWIDYRSTIKKVIVQPGVTLLPMYLFSGYDSTTYKANYPNMKEYVVADTVTRISNEEIAGCSGLERFDISAGINQIMHYISGNSFDIPVKELVIPKGITSIGAVAFNRFTKLESLKFEEGFNSTYSGASEWASAFRAVKTLKSVTIPKSWENIGSYFFARISDLEEIVVLSPETTFSENCFWTIPATGTVVGYKGSPAEAYAESIGWSFREITAEEAETNSVSSLASASYSRAGAISKNTQTSTNIDKIYVLIKSGEYFLDKPLEFDYRDASSSIQVVYTTYGDGKAVLHGGKKIDSTAWELSDPDKNIYRARVEKGTESRQFFVNGVKAIRARELGLLKNCYIDGGSIICENTELLDFDHPEDLELKFHTVWKAPICGVDSVEPTDDGKVKLNMSAEIWNMLLTRDSHMYQYPYTYYRDNNDTSVYHVWTIHSYDNALELLDEEGEWYLDTHGDEWYIYYKPRSFEDINTIEAVLPVTEQLIKVEGKEMLPVQNIEFNDIEFAYTTWMEPTTRKGFAGGQNNTRYEDSGHDYEYTPAAIDVEHATNVDFVDCTMTKLGAVAIKYWNGVKDCDIVGNEIYDISGNGICMGGQRGEEDNLPDDEFKNQNNSVVNNFVYRIGTDYHGASGISTTNGENTTVKNNEIFDVSYMGIHMGFIKNDNYISGLDVSENYIHDVANNMVEACALYNFSSTAGTEENPNVISNNYTTYNWNRNAAIGNDYDTSNLVIRGNVLDGTNTNNCTDDYTSYYLRDWRASDTGLGSLMGGNNLIEDNFGSQGFSFSDPTKGEMRNNNVYEFAVWPEEAKAIIAASGLEEKYSVSNDAMVREIFLNDEMEISLGDTAEIEYFACGEKYEKYLGALEMYCYSDDENIVSIGANNRLLAQAAGETTVRACFKCRDILKWYDIKVTVK